MKPDEGNTNTNTNHMNKNLIKLLKTQNAIPKFNQG